MLKILHTGDLHLGSPFSSLPTLAREKRRTEECEEFRSLCTRANEECVDLFLIAGDLFDTPTPASAVINETLSALEDINCPVVIAPGNHDPYRQGSVYAETALPDNVFVFSSETLSHFAFPEIGNGVDVFGYAFTGDALYESPLTNAPDNACLGDGLSILLCHGVIDDPLSKYAPIRSSDLARCGADYVALGHIHNVEDAPLTLGSSSVSYCGFAFGRSFDERGFGSFRLLTFDENAVNTSPLVTSERIRATERRFAEETLDISGGDSDGFATEKLQNLMAEKGYGSETHLRVTLSGEVALRYRPNTEFLLAQPFPVASLTVKDQTLPIFDAAYLENDPTVRGELYRVLKPKMLSPSAEERENAASAFRIALAALDGRPIL